MDEKLLETIVSTLVSDLISNGKSIFNELVDEGNALLKTGIKRYLEKQLERYSHLKTLLKGNTPVYIYDIYYPLKISLNNEVLKTDYISDVFKNVNFITVIGDAGSGKSTLVKHLFINSIRLKYAIPIMIELRYLNGKSGGLKEHIIEKIFENKISENERIIERLLSSGKFVFFLDGFDELNSDSKQIIANEINNFCHTYSDNKYLLTSRPYSNIENLPLFHNSFIQKLSIDSGDIDGFVFKQLKDEAELAQKIVASIRENTNSHIQSFLANPLLLSLYILTFQSNASVPNKKCIFYRRVINALFSEHDSKTKLGYVREKVSGLDQEQFEEILKKFCFLSYFDSKYDWDFTYIQSQLKVVSGKIDFEFSPSKLVNDLKSAICLWVEDNGIYGFAHRSLQEYFAALLISSLNPDDKKRMYEKIILKLSKARSSEAHNFLSLLEEMDNFYFNKYYTIPLLEEVRHHIKNNNEHELVESFIMFFIDGLSVPSENKSKKYLDRMRPFRININESLVYKSMYFHLPYTRPLHEALSSVTKKKVGNIMRNGIPKTENEERSHTVEIKDSVPTFFFEECFEKVLPIAITFDSYIDNAIEKARSIISSNETTDRELVDLI